MLSLTYPAFQHHCNFPGDAIRGDGSSETRILQSLSQGLAHTASLNSLELGNLNLGDDNDAKSVELLCGGFTTNASLTSLSLRGKIRDSHVAYFVEHGWRSDAPLQHLTLDSIYITIVGLQRLLDATLNHPALQSLTLNLMFRSQQEIFDAMQMFGSALPQLCLQQLRVDLSVCGDGVSQPLPEEIQNDTFYDLIGHVKNNRNLSQFRVSGWNMYQPQQPMFDLRYGL